MRAVAVTILAALAAPSVPMGCATTGAPKRSWPKVRKQGETPAGLQTFRLTVYGMTCDDCALQAARKVRGIRGVVEANVDFGSKQALLRAEQGRVTLADIQSALSSLGFEGLPADQQPLAPLSEEEKKTLDIRTITHGERIDVRAHLAPGKITIFDYYADWCGPCHLLTPKLERLVLKYENVALRKVDLGDWESAAARQASSEFQLPGLPFTRVFDDRGNLLGQAQGNFIEQVESIIRSNANPKRRGRP